MSITVHSPFSGKPVRIRDEDVGRSVRDDAGRVFYVVNRTDGTGYFGSPTRHGNEKDQARYDQVVARFQAQGSDAAPPVHDARGPGRPVQPRRLVAVVLVAIILALSGVGLVLYGPLNFLWPTPPPEAAMPQVVVEILQPGAPDALIAEPGDRVFVEYTGKLTDGTIFDSSLNHGKAFDFTLGRREVIQGWDRGIQGMKVGEKRRLTVPPDLGYGKAGSPPAIPPQATLIFDVALIAVEKP